MQVGFAFFKKTKVMLSSFANDHTDDHFFFSDNQLNFVGVLFLFSRVVAALLFLGCSTADSPISTMIVANTAPSIFSRAFLPGRRNTPLFIRMSSILRTMRQPCDSL